MVDKEFDIDIDDIGINKKEKAISNTHHVSFSRNCYWILLRNSDSKDNIFYVRELCKWAKIQYSTAYNFFENLVNLGYMGTRYTGHYKYYYLIMNSEKPKLKELLSYIKKTLENSKENVKNNIKK